MKYAWKIAAIAVLFVACADKEPVATQYKKQAGAAQAEGDSNPDETPPGGTPPGGTPPAGGGANLEAGKTFYLAKRCDGCHGADGQGGTKFKVGAFPYENDTFTDLGSIVGAHTPNWPAANTADFTNLLTFINSLAPK